jgi:predicted nucleic acid-binding protein
VIVVDSSVWIDYFNGTNSAEVERLDQTIGVDLIVVGDVVLAEVLQGFRSDADFAAARSALEAFDIVPMLGYDLAIRTAENYRALRVRGVAVRKTINMIIGTFCIERGLPLLFSDRDFQPLVDHLGLQVA